MTKLIKRGKYYHIRYYNEEGVVTSKSTHCENVIDAESYQSKWEKQDRPNSRYFTLINDVLDYYYINHCLNNIEVKDPDRIKKAHKPLKLFFDKVKWSNLNDPLINRFKLQRTYKGRV